MDATSVVRRSLEDAPATPTTLDAWSRMLLDTFGAHRIGRIRGADRFHAALVHRRVGDTAISDVVAGPHRMQHEPTPVGVVHANLVVSGSITVSQLDASATVTPGSLILTDPALPYDVECEEGMRLLVLHIPVARATALLGDHRSCLGRGSAPDPVTLAALSALGGPPRGRLGGSLLAEAAVLAACSQLVDGAVAEHPDAERLRHVVRIRSVIRERSHEQGLSVRDVAEGARISVRHAHAVFEDEADTIGQALQRARLDDAHARIAAGWPGSLGALGAAVGFSDAAHFSRAFRARYGRTPSDVRRDASRPASTAVVVEPSPRLR